jgi:glycosyltransferase involved in cell wall biosynthesis
MVHYPIFIPVRDRLEVLAELVAWLERAGQEEIWLVDNDSTYEPLVDYLAQTPHRVVRLERNLGHRSPWLSGVVQREAVDRPFVVTDPDVIPVEECPLDVIDHFAAVLDRYPGLHKVGFGLKIDDLPDHYPLAAEVRDWEGRFWVDEIAPDLYKADIDTTFALYRAGLRRHEDNHAARTGGVYQARHLAWYVDPEHLSDDERYYREHADRTISNWNRDRAARWKLRHLDVESGA